MALKYDAYNDAVKRWGAAGRDLITSTGKGLNIAHVERSPSNGESLKKIKEKYGYDSTGVINRVIFGTINRSLIYTTHGAGKGIGGSKGSRWIDKHGNRKQTKDSSMGKLGTASRKAKPFIDQALDSSQGVEQLADIVSTYQADAIIDSVFVK